MWMYGCGYTTIRPSPHPNECPVYSTKHTDGKVQVILELGGMWTTTPLPSFSSPLCLGVVPPDRVLSMGQIELIIEVIQGLRMRGSWKPNRNCNILTPNIWPSTLCLSRSLDAQPETLWSTLLGAGFLYCILSAASLVPKLHRSSRGSPRPGVAFATTSRL